MRLLAGWIALLVLAAVNLGLSTLSLGHWSLALPLIVAAIMAAIVTLLFMKLDRALAISRVFAVAGLFWLAIMFTLAGTDYFTRIVYPVVQQ